MRWVLPNSQGSPLLAQRIAYKTLGDAWSDPVLLSESDTSFTLTESVIAGERYSFKLEAQNAVGWGPAAFVEEVIAGQTPLAPTDVQISLTEAEVGV